MIKPPLPYGGVTLSVALTFEDALVEEGEEEPGYWTYARVMAESLGAGRSIFFFFLLIYWFPKSTKYIHIQNTSH